MHYPAAGIHCASKACPYFRDVDLPANSPSCDSWQNSRMVPRLIIGGALLAAGPIVPAQAQVQATSPGAAPYPVKLVRMITGSTAGGAADITARQIGGKLAESFGQQVLIDNRPGLAGMLANELTAKSPADGYTLLFQPGSFITLSTQINARGGAWDPLKHLAPVIQVSSYYFVLVVHPSVPARTVQQLIAVARAQPRALTFVSSGVGSNFHLAGELFKLGAKVDMWHVPYKGSPPAIVDLIAGRAELMFMQVPPVLSYIRNGRLRALGVTGTTRHTQLPDVPTIAEAALPGYELGGSEGILAPLNVPRDVVMKVNTLTGAILQSTEMKETWAGKAVEYAPNTPEQYAAKIRAEYDKTTTVLKAAGIRNE
jgi:tripartite-type tricarboxylate transporter receptor subunit TctC